jgi:dihydroorotate dehydrogenase
VDIFALLKPLIQHLCKQKVYSIIKFLLFLLPPERAHYVTMSLLTFATNIPGLRWCFEQYSAQNKAKPVHLAGLVFKNKIGLAAGFDKNGAWLRPLSALGFGHIEVGTVTPIAQDGNDKPRLFRLPKDGALINRMGFNNAGVEVLKANLERDRSYCHSRNMLIGINIGKNKVTPNERAADDYLYCFRELFHLADYFVVNVSSPNTPNLRELQEKAPLIALLGALQSENAAKPQQKPIFLKIAPDLSEEQLLEIGQIVDLSGIAGIVATNTTIRREALHTPKNQWEAMGAGGLSGAPVGAQSTAVLLSLNRILSPKVAQIGVGGIDSLATAQDKIAAGAQLIQVYTGFIYHGPWLIRAINKGT